MIATSAPELGWSPETRQMIADWARQFGGTKPPASAESTAAQSSVAETQKVQQLEADIAAVRQTVEQRLAAEQQTVEQLAARQDQLVSEITTLQAATSRSLRESQRILRRVTSQQRNVDLRHVK
jgi:DNA-binding ferritin-like protein